MVGQKGFRMVLKAEEPKVKTLEGKGDAAVLVPSGDGEVAGQTGRSDLQGMIAAHPEWF